MARNSIILNGKSSDTITGLLIQELPPISKPLMRTQVEEIDGRDGDIVTKLGFSAYDKEISVGLYGNFDINEVIAFFNSEGEVIFSNEPDKYYYYQILDQIDFERLVRFRTATVKFHVQPFKYSTTDEAETLGGETPVSDEGTFLTLDNSAEAPFSELTLKGDSEQKTYTGKNLFNAMSALTYKWLNGTTGLVVDSNDPNVVGGLLHVTVGATYVISGIDGLQFNLFTYTDDNFSNPVRAIANSTTIRTFTATTEWLRFAIGGGDAVAIMNGIQFEQGSTATDYEPYVGGIPAPNPDFPQDIKVVTGEQMVKVTGRNLCPPMESGAFNNNTGNKVSSATAVRTPSPISVEPSTTYIFSQNGKARAGWILEYGQNGFLHIANYIAAGSTFTTSSDTTSINIHCGISAGTTGFQLEKGSAATDFSKYEEQSYSLSLGELELCKIGDYQDYLWTDGEKWWKHRVLSKLILNGSENWYASGAVVDTGVKAFYTAGGLEFNNWKPGLCNIATVRTSGSAWGSTAGKKAGNAAFSGNNIYLKILETDASTAAELKTFLATQPMIVYYPLDTATDEEITNETLLAQLEALAGANSYQGRTHIISISGSADNLPHIVAATALTDSSGEVVNSGNTTSKPKLTIYGSGDITVSLNGIQLFQIALGDTGYITIDTAAMEAYKDTISDLKNRLVTGDYSKFALKPGANQIDFTGTVTKCIVENYSRWL